MLEKHLQAIKDALEKDDTINAACAVNRLASAWAEGERMGAVELQEGHGGRSVQCLEGVLIRLLRLAILGEAIRDAGGGREEAARLVQERRGTTGNRPVAC